MHSNFNNLKNKNMTAKDYLKEQGIHPSDPIYWYGDDDVITLEQLLESYHQSKLKLLGIADVSGLACKCGNQIFTRRHSNWIECTACNKIQVLQA